MLCCCHLGICNHLQRKDPIFSFCTGPNKLRSQSSFQASRGSLGRIHLCSLTLFSLLIYFWWCQIFTAVRAFLELQQAGPGLSVRCVAFSWRCLLLLQSTGSRVSARSLWPLGLVVLAGGIFPVQGWNLCLLHWHADSLPPRRQGSPDSCVLIKTQQTFPGSKYFRICRRYGLSCYSGALLLDCKSGQR